MAGMYPSCKSSGQLTNYSVVEKRTGQRWLDGHDVYQMSSPYGGTNIPYNETWVDTGIEITGDLILAYGSITRDGDPLPIGYLSSSVYSYLKVENGKLKIKVKGFNTEVYKIGAITAIYTKNA